MQELQKYKDHPRILELRIIMIYRNIANEYGVNKATELFQALSKIMNVDWQKINGIINNVYKIRRLEKLDRKRFRQEVVFMGHIYGESKYFIAQNYLNIHIDTLYRKTQQLKLSDFVTTDWLGELDNNVQICGIPQYATEAARFLHSYTILMETLGRVSTSKIKL